MAERLVRNEFTLEDLRDQLRQIRRLGPLAQVMEMMPKVGPFKQPRRRSGRRGAA